MITKCIIREIEVNIHRQSDDDVDKYPCRLNNYITQANNVDVHTVNKLNAKPKEKKTAHTPKTKNNNQNLPNYNWEW